MRDPNLDAAAKHPDQSYFTISPTHGSKDHERHTRGSRDYYQQDVHLHSPHTGKVINSIGVSAPPPINPPLG